MRKNLLIIHKCTLKKETNWKRGHLERKMTEGKKVGPNDAHGGCVTKKGWIRSGVEQKSQCATYTHTAYVGWRTGGGAGPTSLCSVVQSTQMRPFPLRTSH
jgi:hypothetical protein